MNIFKEVFEMFSSKAHTVGGAVSSGIGSPSWSARDYANFAKEAYITNFVGFRCINMIAQAVASVPWKVFSQSGTQRIEQEQHPLMRILNRANPSQGFADFQLGVTSYLGIAGNSYVERLSPETGPNKGLPLELHTHRPDYIKPQVNSDGVLLGYELNINGKVLKEWPIDPITGQSDLLHIKFFHPTDDILGLSPVEPAAKSIDTSNEALTWNKNLLQNDARPGTLFIFDQALGDTQFERLQKQLNSKVSGADNAGKNLIVEGAMKDAKPFGFSPKDMDFLQGNWDLVRQICLTFGVPPQLLGVPGDSTFANFEQAMLYFWEFTIFFYLRLLKEEYNNWFFPDDDKVFIDYVLDKVPALEPRRKEKWTSVNEATFLTIDEKREMLGLEKTPGGDVVLVSNLLLPLDMVGVTEEEIDDSENANDGED
jgi:HK97 family phage portal protein